MKNTKSKVETKKTKLKKARNNNNKNVKTKQNNKTFEWKNLPYFLKMHIVFQALEPTHGKRGRKYITSINNSSARWRMMNHNKQ